MTTDLLFINAQQALRTVPASGWDSAGYNLFLSFNINSGATEEELLDTWKKAIAYLHASKSAKFYAYARAHGRFAGVTSEQIAREQNEHIETEIADWGMVKFRLVERVSDTITFLTVDGRDFDITTDDLFSQANFRKAYFRGTDKMLPEISRKAYQKFIEKLPFTVAEGYSQTKKEIIDDTLQEMVNKLGNMQVETEKEAIELMINRGRAIYDHFLFFKYNDLVGELRQNNRPYEQQSIVVALRQLDARKIRRNSGNYWVYSFKNEPEQMEIAAPDPVPPEDPISITLEKVNYDQPEPSVGSDSDTTPF